MRQAFTLFLLLLISCSLQAQETQEASKEKLVVQPILVMQLWSTYTEGQQVYDTDNQQFEVVDNRLNFELHRTRVGAKGSYGDRWVYDLTGSLDFVGQDPLAGTVGAPNNGASPRFRIWNALVQYKASQQSEALYMTFGYQCPHVSRESITSPFTVSSFEKSWSQNYIRRHMVGVGPGRVVGLNVGGFNKMEGADAFAFNYDIGIYNPRYTAFSGNSTGSQYAPLLTGRLGIHIGDPETTKYSRGHKFNYKGNRNGVTLAVSGSHTGGTNLWNKNQSFGVDILANYGDINIAGEWMQLSRTVADVSTTASTGFLKLGYYTTLKNTKGFEPVITYSFLSGATEEREQADASSIGAFFGKDNYLEMTLNYYVSAKARMSLSYTLRNGDAGAIDPTLVNNNYFQRGGVGAIERGNYLGIGLLFNVYGK